MGIRVQVMLVAGLCMPACGFDSSNSTGNGNDGGGAGGGDGGGGVGNGDGGSTSECGAITAVLRDFKADHPDMEATVAGRQGLVEDILGADKKPVYAPNGSTPVTESAETFDQWYRDVAGVNMRFEQELVLDEVSEGTFVFDDSDFFPLDGLGWPGEETQGHNFHFTTEINGTFLYEGGELFTFRGDDDVFVFVNERLALDLGGVHAVQEATIDFDAKAAELGITVGEVYRLDVFHAERHTSQSNFRIETSIECLGVVVD